jgi:hypothetical protein
MKDFIMPKYAALLLLTFVFWNNGNSVEILNDSLDLTCNQSDSYILACSYRPLPNTQITGITPSIAGKPLEMGTWITYPAADSITAILFIVDTSDPGRQEVITKNASQIEKMLNAIEPHHIFGFANFDKELNISAPLARDKSRIISAANELQATGLTTELYRNIIKAIEFLGRTNADRKVLFLFSDGQAEDKAYFHEDVVNVSRRYGVVINSLGFPRSIPLSVALQTLRRLSEETGGIFLEADENFDLPNPFISRPYTNIDRGGHFIIDLTGIEDTDANTPGLVLRFDTPTGNIPVLVPVKLMRQAAPVQQPAILLPPAPVIQAQAGLPSQSAEPGFMDFLLWYGVPIALLVLIILTLFTLFLIFRRQKEDSASNKITYAEIKPLAYLITQDEKAKSYPVTSATWRIGRSMDNELTIPDNSISRRHAEIQRESNGQFVVYDRGSTNGVYVNNHKVTRHLLHEGDIIEIGDIFLRFTQHPEDFQLAEETAVLKTRAPEFN